MPFPIDVTRMLEYAPMNTPLRVASVPFENVRASLSRDGLCEGDEIVCQHDSNGRTLVTTADGRHSIVDCADAVVIEVAGVARERGGHRQETGQPRTVRMSRMGCVSRERR